MQPILGADKTKGGVMKNLLRVGVVVLAVYMGWGIWGCGGTASSNSGSSGGGGGATALEIANQMSLVEAQEESTPSASLGSKFLLLKALTTDTSTAYYTDPLDIWVHDDSMEALSIINEILCSFEQTLYAEKLNAGPYIALVDNAKCNNDKSSESDSESSSSAVEYETWFVDSSRASGADPQIVLVKIFQEETEFEPPMTIEARVTITEAVSDTKPYGDFELDFEMSDETESELVGQGKLTTVDRDDGQVQFVFSMRGLKADFLVSEDVNVVMSADGTTGYAYASHSFGGFESGSYNVAFNDLYYKAEKDDGDVKCLDRRNFNSHTFRYGVYNEDGSRLELANPGFGIQYTDGDREYWGFAGNWGVWLDEDIFADGLEVIRPSNDATYTLRVVDGKLVKHTQQQIALEDIKDAYLNYWDNDNMRDLRVSWDGSNFVVDAARVCEPETPCTWQELDAYNLTLMAGSWLNFWRDGLGSLFFVVPDDPNTVSDETTVTYDSSENLNARASEFDGGEITLYCFENCLRANITSEQINWMDGQSPYFPFSEDLGTPYVYTISPDDMMLKYEGEEVKLRAGVTSTGQNQWGVNSGAMVLSTNGLDNIWEIYGQSVYYTWETGPNQWNKLTGLVDSNGDYVEFDPPIMLQYAHTDGVKYQLEFQGEGELHGIPWEQVEGTDRWYPLITIPDGSVATTGENTSYYIRALEKEQQMQLLDDAVCSELVYEELEMPDITFESPDIGDLAPTGEPAVIGGVLVE